MNIYARGPLAPFPPKKTSDSKTRLFKYRLDLPILTIFKPENQYFPLWWTFSGRKCNFPDQACILCSFDVEARIFQTKRIRLSESPRSPEIQNPCEICLNCQKKKHFIASTGGISSGGIVALVLIPLLLVILVIATLVLLKWRGIPSDWNWFTKPKRPLRLQLPKPPKLHVTGTDSSVGRASIDSRVDRLGLPALLTIVPGVETDKR